MAAGMRLAKITPTQTRYFHKDHLGSSVVMTDEAGSPSETTEYMPYGQDRVHTGLNESGYKFTDQERDAETGLYNYGARLYDPVIGQFITPDSIVPNIYDPQQLNPYAYCRNNPLVYTDPSGHSLMPMDDFMMDQFRVDHLMNDMMLDQFLSDIRLEDSLRIDTIAWQETDLSPTSQFSPLIAENVSPTSSAAMQALMSNKNVSWEEKMRASEGIPRDLPDPNIHNPYMTHNFDLSKGTRLPDFYSANIVIADPGTFNTVGWSGTAGIDRYGNFYWSPLGVAVGKSAAGCSLSLTANWINGPRPSEEQLSNFLGGHGTNFSAGFLMGISESLSPGNGSATGIGFFYPYQFGASHNYSFQVD